MAENSPEKKSIKRPSGYFKSNTLVIPPNPANYARFLRKSMSSITGEAELKSDMHSKKKRVSIIVYNKNEAKFDNAEEKGLENIQEWSSPEKVIKLRIRNSSEEITSFLKSNIDQSEAASNIVNNQKAKKRAEGFEQLSSKQKELWKDFCKDEIGHSIRRVKRRLTKKFRKKELFKGVGKLFIKQMLAKAKCESQRSSQTRNLESSSDELENILSRKMKFSEEAEPDFNSNAKLETKKATPRRAQFSVITKSKLGKLKSFSKRRVMDDRKISMLNRSVFFKKKNYKAIINWDNQKTNILNRVAKKETKYQSLFSFVRKMNFKIRNQSKRKLIGCQIEAIKAFYVAKEPTRSNLRRWQLSKASKRKRSRVVTEERRIQDVGELLTRLNHEKFQQKKAAYNREKQKLHKEEALIDSKIKSLERVLEEIKELVKEEIEHNIVRIKQRGIIKKENIKLSNKILQSILQNQNSLNYQFYQKSQSKKKSNRGRKNFMLDDIKENKSIYLGRSLGAKPKIRSYFGLNTLPAPKISNNKRYNLFFNMHLMVENSASLLNYSNYLKA